MAKKTNSRTVETLKHGEAKRKNIPTAEYQSVMQKEEQDPKRVAYPRASSGLEAEKQARNLDLDPQLVWRGKDEQDWSDLVVHAPPLYIQEKVHPKALIDDLLRETRERAHEAGQLTPDLFSDFNGIPKDADKTEFYQHDQNWSNRMILGDSLQVMASLAEREGLRGQVQCIYLDPPYGIRFNSNFQWSTTDKGGTGTDSLEKISREPEQVKAFRDTWRDGIHSYLTYLRDRLTVARDLLKETGSIFVQIGDENVHRVRAVMDEVFGDENFITEILVKKKGSQKSGTLEAVNDFILWYAKSEKASGLVKVRPLYEVRVAEEIFEDFPVVELESGERIRITDLEDRDCTEYRKNYSAFVKKYSGARLIALNPLKSGGFRRKQSLAFEFQKRMFPIEATQCWKHTVAEDDGSTPGMVRLGLSNRLFALNKDLRFVRYSPTPSIRAISNWWDGFGGAPNQVYVVQTNERVVERCVLMATDPGDLVIDPTCGSGTTAYVAEQWGRRWITIDTSRVALALARARVMGARYAYYLLADSREGQIKEAEVTRTAPSSQPTHGSIRQGFVCQRVSNATSADIANNAEIDVIWEKWQAELEPLREKLNGALKKSWDEWEIPREADAKWAESAKKVHAQWWEARIARQKEIDASIQAKAEFEFLYDKPYEERRKVRVAGPFTVESLSPHRVLGVDEDDELIDSAKQPGADYAGKQTFPQMILENLKTAGVQQAHKEDRIVFTSLTPWPGELVCAEGRYVEGNTEGGKEKRAAIFIGPEFGTVTRPDLVAAAREAGDADFDALIACAFNYEAHATEFSRLGRILVLKARMNADLHMADDLKNTGKGNLFVIFGEPDITVLDERDGKLRVKVNGVDVFHPQTGEVRSDGPEGIAC
jgi:adenine-specific DNA-methyltransferase